MLHSVGARLVLSLGVAAVLLLVCVAIEPVWAQRPFTVEWNQEQLSVFADGAPLVEVLAELARRTGLELRGISDLKQGAYAHFAGLPLREGVMRLLANVNCAILENTTGPAGKTQLVVVVIGGTSGVRTVGPRREETTAVKAPSVSEASPELLAGLQRAAKDGDSSALRKAAANGDRVAQAVALQLLSRLDPDQASALAATAARSPDLNRRLNSLQVLGDLDSPVAAQALGAALDDPNAVVRQAAVMGLIGQSGPDAAGFLVQASRDRNASIRRLALDFLAQRGPLGENALASALNGNDPQVSPQARELLEQTSARQ